MARLLFIFFFLLQAQLTFAQNVKTISIDAVDARAVNLSEIAETVTPIVLEKLQGMLRNFFLTDEYLFVATDRSIEQFDLSGKHIRTTDCKLTIMSNITGDPLKEELYVFFMNKFRCYDFSGNMKREYVLETNSLYSLFHKGVLWIQSDSVQPDQSAVYMVNKINPATGKAAQIPYEWKDKPRSNAQKDDFFIHVAAASQLTLYGDEVIASFEMDDALYKIRQDKVIPCIRWSISHSAQSDIIRKPSPASGFIGEYLFVNYRFNNQYYIYFENMKSGKKYNANKIVDDIFQTSGNCTLKPVNQKDSFYFIKDKSDIKGEKIGEIPLKNGPVVFIVKPK